jgi:hypothetical protein
MRSLVMGFRTILRIGKIETLNNWMKTANDSDIYGMQRFVHRLKQGLSAVEGAVEETWSNGPVEVQISRLKTIKRQMYGRAGFELRRARVLPLPPPVSLHQSEEEPKWERGRSNRVVRQQRCPRSQPGTESRRSPKVDRLRLLCGRSRNAVIAKLKMIICNSLMCRASSSECWPKALVLWPPTNWPTIILLLLLLL